MTRALTAGALMAVLTLGVVGPAAASGMIRVALEDTARAVE